MKIGAYQFKVTGNIKRNYDCIKDGIEKAAKYGVKLLVFPECAVTGYPPYCIESSSKVDFELVNDTLECLQELSEIHNMSLVVGTIVKEESRYFNAAFVFRPGKNPIVYRKRALWGWDRDNFSDGHDSGVTEIDSLKIGVRICYEIRFPEFFRQLYKANTDLNIVLFYDVSDIDNPDRFRLIKGHIQTRAVENVCPILTCNTSAEHQTAPTGLYDRSGYPLVEAACGTDALIVFDYEKTPLKYGELGRKKLSDSLIASDFS